MSSSIVQVHAFEVLYTATTATSIRRGVAFIGLLLVLMNDIGRADGITVHLYDSKRDKFKPKLNLTGPYDEEKKVSYQNKDFLHGRKVEMTFKFDSANQVC